MINFLIKTLRRNYPIILILGLTALNRFANLDRNFIFGVDEEYQAYLAKTIVEHFHIIWIGVGSTVGFYLGPFWTYLTAFLLFLSKGDPLITGYFAGGLGVATAALLYFICRKMSDGPSGIITALLYACLPLIVFYDQRYWNVSAIPFISLLLFLSAWESKKNPYWLVVFALTSGFIFHIHLTLIPIALVSLIWLIAQNSKIPKLPIILSLAIFFITIFPLIAFDYFHKWSNITAPIRLIQATGSEPSQLNLHEHSRAFLESLGRLWYLAPNQPLADEINWGCTSVGNLTSNISPEMTNYWQTIDKITTRDTPNILASIGAITILLAFLFMKQTWKKEETKLLAYLLIAQGLLFLLFPGPAYEYYLLSFFALYFLAVSQVLYNATFSLKLVLTAIFVFLSFLGIITVNSAQEDFGLANKKAVIREVVGFIGNKPFYLKEEGMCHIAEGWRYLFITYGKKPVASSTDRMFGWIYEKEIDTKTKPLYEVVMAESRATQPLDEFLEKKFESGGFKAYILKADR